MTVRLATQADAGALADVAAATFRLACPPSTTEEAMAGFIATALSEAAFDRYLADSNRIVLVDDSDEGTSLAGYVLLVLGEPTDADVVTAVRIRPTVELSKCYVREGHHGRGVAGALLRRSMEVAAQRGARGMWLGTNEQNARAIRFYEKHGFQRVGSKLFRLGDVDEHDHVFERDLGSVRTASAEPTGWSDA